MLQSAKDRFSRLSERRPGLVAVAIRVISRSAEDGYIHAGHLAYLSIVTLFPLTILIMAITAAFGETGAGRSTIGAMLSMLPGDLATLFRPIVQQVLEARTGWLLWIGGVVALWTVTTFVETVRDINFRAFEVKRAHGFVARRIQSTAGTVIAILLASGIFMLQVLMAVLVRLLNKFLGLSINIPGWLDQVRTLELFVTLSQMLAPLALFLALWGLLKLLTPPEWKYDRTWPGALVTTIAWVVASLLLGPVMTALFNLSLTYGALSSVMLAMLFFYFVGFALVVGIELNAALAALSSTSRPA